ncbi:hypothetical protein SALBM135S_09679 [Streptomyces alboniger]
MPSLTRARPTLLATGAAVAGLLLGMVSGGTSHAADDASCRPDGLYRTPGVDVPYCSVYDSEGREKMGADHQRRVIGYFTGWRTGKNGEPAYLAPDIPWGKVTHVNYAFGHIDKDNKLSVGSDGEKNAATGMTWPGVAGAEMDPSLPYKGHFNLLNKFKKQHPNVKTLISVGGWAETGGYFGDDGKRVGSGGFYSMATNADGSVNQAGIDTFADSAVAFIKKYGFNGVDIDYEYPTSMKDAGHPSDFPVSNARRGGLVKGYAALMKSLREKLDRAGAADGKHYMLTVAAPSSGYLLRGMETFQVGERGTARAAHLPAEDDAAGVEDGRHGRRAHGDAVRDGVEEGAVGGLHRVPHEVRRGHPRGPQAVLRPQVEECRGADQGVEAALTAGGRGQAARARHRQEADLPRAAGRPPAQGPFEHDRGAHAVPEPEQHERVPAVRGAVPLFRAGREVRLVLHQDARAEPLLERTGEPAVPGGQGRRVVQVARGGVDEARRADADGVQPPDTALARRTADQVEGALQGGLRVAADGRGGFGEDRAEQIRDDHGDALRTDVERGEVGPVGDDPVQPGIRPAPLGTRLADDGDEPGALEPLDEVGHGGPGEAGELLQLVGREGPFALQEAQREPVVDGPSGTR